MVRGLGTSLGLRRGRELSSHPRTGRSSSPHSTGRVGPGALGLRMGSARSRSMRDTETEQSSPRSDNITPRTAEDPLLKTCVQGRAAAQQAIAVGQAEYKGLRGAVGDVWAAGCWIFALWYASMSPIFSILLEGSNKGKKIGMRTLSPKGSQTPQNRCLQKNQLQEKRYVLVALRDRTGAQFKTKHCKKPFFEFLGQKQNFLLLFVSAKFRKFFGVCPVPPKTIHSNGAVRA